ncbi:hypothetical protein TNCV_2077271 [Trichonephila clavipes]|nr:hypothetical protein TNCV_2077271 [Trichonephila clavipes]
MNMNRYTNTELADTHFIYDLAKGSERAAVRLYREINPTRRQPNHQTFTRVYQNLAEQVSIKGTIESTGRLPASRTPIFEEGVLHAVEINLGTVVCAFALGTGRSQTTVHCVLQGETLHLFHVQIGQLL